MLDLTVPQQPDVMLREILKLLQGSDGASVAPSEEVLLTAQQSSYLEPISSFVGGTVNGTAQQFVVNGVEIIEGVGTPYIVVFHGTHTEPLRVRTADNVYFDIIPANTRVTIGVFSAGDPKEFVQIQTESGNESTANLGYTVYAVKNK